MEYEQKKRQISSWEKACVCVWERETAFRFLKQQMREYKLWI